MSITLTGTGGLFTRLGQAFGALDALNTCRGTTFPDTLDDILAQLTTGSIDVQATAGGIPAAADSFRAGGKDAANRLAIFCQALLITMVREDVPQVSNDLTLSLRELIRQMVAASASVDASTPGLTITADGSNVTNIVLIGSTKRADGLTAEHILAENLTAEVISATLGSEQIRITGQSAIADLLSDQWPSGSGSDNTILATDSGNSNLLTNGGFENEANRTNSPDGWEVVVGTVGTAVKITDVEQQTVAISGSPAGGWYTLKYTNAASKIQTTTPLAYNATASAVEAALRSLTGLEAVTVTSTGTTPNFTHTIVFNGLGGNVTQLTNASALTGGSSPAVTNATTVAGDTHTFLAGKAMQWVSDGSVLTCVQQKVSLQALTQYGFNVWLEADVGPAAGVMRFSLWDGSAVINDQQGTANSSSFNASTITTSYVAHNVIFRTPLILPPIVYLRMELTTAVTNTRSIYFDEAVLKAVTNLYDGGLPVAAFSGNIPAKPGSPQIRGDFWGLAATNDRAGAFQEKFQRVYNMAARQLILPSNNSNSETILDSLIG